MAKDTIAAVSESTASGEIAEIYADIRETMGVSAINLVWRHIATIDGGLRWAWDAARPLYASGLIETECEHMLAALSLPQLPPIPEPTLSLVGAKGDDRAVIEAVLDTYNRGNAFNMVALSTLIVDPSNPPPADRPSVRVPASTVAMPPIPEVSELGVDVAEQVLILNGLGAKPGPNRVIASIYKHLALWPEYLALTWGQLAPLQADGTLTRLTEETASLARQHSAYIAGALGPRPAGATADQVRKTVAEFTDTAIARMIPIGQMMRKALAG